MVDKTRFYQNTKGFFNHNFISGVFDKRIFISTDVVQLSTAIATQFDAVDLRLAEAKSVSWHAHCSLHIDHIQIGEWHYDGAQWKCKGMKWCFLFSRQLQIISATGSVITLLMSFKWLIAIAMVVVRIRDSGWIDSIFHFIKCTEMQNYKI